MSYGDGIANPDDHRRWQNRRLRDDRPRAVGRRGPTAVRARGGAGVAAVLLVLGLGVTACGDDGEEVLTTAARDVRACLAERQVATTVGRAGLARNDDRLEEVDATQASEGAEAVLRVESGGPAVLPGGGVADAPISVVELFFYADDGSAQAAANRVGVAPEPSRSSSHVTVVERIGSLLLVHSSVDFVDIVASLSPTVAHAVRTCSGPGR